MRTEAIVAAKGTSGNCTCLRATRRTFLTGATAASAVGLIGTAWQSRANLRSIINWFEERQEHERVQAREIETVKRQLTDQGKDFIHQHGDFQRQIADQIAGLKQQIADGGKQLKEMNELLHVVARNTKLLLPKP